MNIKLNVSVGVVAALALFACGNLSFAGDASGPTPFPTDASAYPGQGPTRTYPYMSDNRKYFWTKRAEAQGSIVFVGDSLTGNWKTLGVDFPGLKIANRGIGGDGSRVCLFRFQEDVLDLHPKAIVLMIGTNDLSAKGPVEGIISNISTMLAMVEKMSPVPPVIMCSFPPREAPKAPIENGELLKMNAGIEKLAKSKPYVTFLDLYPNFLTADGKLDEHYFRADKIHLEAPGYAKWAELLKPVFVKLKL